MTIYLNHHPDYVAVHWYPSYAEAREACNYREDVVTKAYEEEGNEDV